MSHISYPGAPFTSEIAEEGFHHWIETVDGVIIDPTAGQFELDKPTRLISWPDSPTYARYTYHGAFRLCGRMSAEHPRAEA